MSVTDKSLKQESMLQEEINSFHNANGETPDCEVEEAKPEPQSITTATQVENGVLHYRVFTY